MPTGWAEFVDNSQRYQADLLKYAIEHYRRAKYTRIGSFFQFEFIDCWPAITWSVVSYGRKPKLGYYAIQQTFQPVLIEADLARTVWSKGKDPQHLAEVGLGIPLDLWVINDEHRELAGTTYDVHLRGQGKDFTLASGKPKETIPSDGVVQLPKLYSTLPAEVSPGSYQLVLTLTQDSKVLSENVYSIAVVE